MATNISIAGLGGQGVLKASDVVAEAAFRSGADVKKSEVHGMSQRGGSVCGEIRFGEQVWSPMIPPGEADFLVALAPGEVEPNRHRLRSGGILIGPDRIDPARLENRKCLNIALLGVLSRHLSLTEEHWLAALRGCLPEKILEINLRAFQLGRQAPA
ncbi:MAG: indolepyruvate oxidoreductase subunit beta [Verrucomicrobiae bacterium]|nr:indolepyruvate oxidoreductase subunit beta [Verrucomicrobiae bacterium]